jgi:hypothetical protein
LGASEEKAVPAPIVRPIVLYGICIVHQYIRKKIAITQIKQELFAIQKGVRTNVENKAELLFLQKHPSLPLVFSGVHVTQSLVFCEM